MQLYVIATGASESETRTRFDSCAWLCSDFPVVLKAAVQTGHGGKRERQSCIENRTKTFRTRKVSVLESEGHYTKETKPSFRLMDVHHVWICFRVVFYFDIFGFCSSFVYVREEWSEIFCVLRHNHIILLEDANNQQRLTYRISLTISDCKCLPRRKYSGAFL